MSDDRLRRWRLVLGSDAEGLGGATLDGDDVRRNGALALLYGARGLGGGSPVDNRAKPTTRSAGLRGSAPTVARWLGDIRTYFPTSVVRVLQHDAMERLGLRELLLEPELLTDKISDPVEVLFATQLGGGTDINRAVSYCQGLITRPGDTIFILLTDLIEGGLRDKLIGRMAALVEAGVVTVALLALNDDGSPAYEHSVAAALAGVGVAAFACTPDQFPDLMAAAIERRDLGRWAAEQGIATSAPTA